MIASFKNQGTEDIFNSIRINKQYRVCFSWGDSGAKEVEIVDYH